MTREELIAIVKELMDPVGKSERHIDNLFELFAANVPHPSPIDLIYFDDLTAEEVVDTALSYKPTQL